VDPVTGLSRKQGIALALLIPLGMVASTVATVRSERGDAVCPEGVSEGCSISEEGEAVVIGVIGEPASPAGGAEVFGHPIRADTFDTGCDVEETSHAARDTTDNPPDYPPAALVLVSVCEEAAIAPLQIAEDEGIPAVAYGEATSVATPLERHLVSEQPSAGVAELFELFSAALTEVAVQDGERVLIPLSRLRLALLEGGFRES
jgi:hypothetical protein